MKKQILKLLNEEKGGFKMKNLGKWWNDKNIEIYEIEGRKIALNGWNGEVYNECFEVSEDLHEILEKNLKVKPIYEQVDEDDFKIIDYEFSL